MKKSIFLLALVFITSIGYSQKKDLSIYKQVYDFDVYQKDWALVKSITGNYGIIDRNGKEVVPTIYKRIEKFGKIEKDFAIVKSISGNYGIIDRNGKEVIPTIYEKIGEFSKIEKGLALVKNTAGFYGFINKNGKEIVQSSYSQKQIKSGYYKIDKKKSSERL